MIGRSRPTLHLLGVPLETARTALFASPSTPMLSLVIPYEVY